MDKESEGLGQPPQDHHADQRDPGVLSFVQAEGLVIESRFSPTTLDDLLFGSPPLSVESLPTFLGPDEGMRIGIDQYLVTALLIEEDKELEALSLLNERLDREERRRGGVGLAQLAEMINTAISDAK